MFIGSSGSPSPAPNPLSKGYLTPGKSCSINFCCLSSIPAKPFKILVPGRPCLNWSCIGYIFAYSSGYLLIRFLVGSRKSISFVSWNAARPLLVRTGRPLLVLIILPSLVLITPPATCFALSSPSLVVNTFNLDRRSFAKSVLPCFKASLIRLSRLPTLCSKLLILSLVWLAMMPDSLPVLSPPVLTSAPEPLFWLALYCSLILARLSSARLLTLRCTRLRFSLFTFLGPRPLGIMFSLLVLLLYQYLRFWQVEIYLMVILCQFLNHLK